MSSAPIFLPSESSTDCSAAAHRADKSPVTRPAPPNVVSSCRPRFKNPLLHSDGDRQQDRLYIVDMTARIQVFDADGNFIRSWQTPVHDNGRPTGMSIDRDGNLAVADTHYYQVLFYSPEGELLRKIGGTRQEPGRGSSGW